MAADARQTSHPIEQRVTNELEANSAFDPDITYSKGSAMLRMLEAYLGEDRFRDGVRVYMQAHAYSNASSDDLWRSLGQTSGSDVAAIAAAWTEQPGFPLVTAAAHCDAQGARTLTLTQQRFLLRGNDTAGLRWKVPLQLRVGSQSQARPVLLTADGQTVAAGGCDEALSVNAGAVGYYRVTYDPPRSWPSPAVRQPAQWRPHRVARRPVGHGRGWRAGAGELPGIGRGNGRRPERA